MGIRNLILDLGGVILNLDFNRTADAFTQLGVGDFNQFFTQYHAHPLFQQLEKGATVGGGFYDEFRAATGLAASDAEINLAWNAMLLDFKQPVLSKLEQWAQYGAVRLFLLSNTNAIHHAYFTHTFQSSYGYGFDSLFEKAWYSHLIGHRKPDRSAFEFVLKDAGIEAGETLFIDDTQPNLDTATAVGLHTALATPTHTVVEIASEWGL